MALSSADRALASVLARRRLFKEEGLRALEAEVLERQRRGEAASITSCLLARGFAEHDLRPLERRCARYARECVSCARTTYLLAGESVRSFPCEHCGGRLRAPELPNDAPRRPRRTKRESGDRLAPLADEIGALLVVKEGATTSQPIVVPAGGTITLGRSSRATTRFDDKKLSHQHCALSLEGELAVVDLGSVTGTLVNGKRIAERTVLREGDELRIGGLAIEVKISGTVESANRPGTARLAPGPSPTPKAAAAEVERGAEKPLEGSAAPTQRLQRPERTPTPHVPAAVLHGERVELRRLQQELEGASRIQRKLLPTVAPVVPGLELAGLFIPAIELGGDIYDFFLQGESLFVSIGDVSGKGIGSAIVMATVRALLRAYSERERRTDRILWDMNRALARDLEHGTFVSFLLLRYEPVSGEVRYSGAGHEHMLLSHARGDVEVLRTGGVVLGLSADVSDRIHEQELLLRPGDALVLYTDGATEARSASGRELGLRRLSQIVREAGSVSAAGMIDHVVGAVRDFHGGGALDDDLTLVVARRFLEEASAS